MRSSKKRSSALANAAKAAPLLSELARQQSLLSGNVWPKLDLHQKRAVRFILKRKFAFVLYKQGTGKTWIGLSVLESLAAWHGEMFRALLVVPLTNRESSWAKSIREELPGLQVTDDFNVWRKATRSCVLLVHYEALPAIIKKLVRVRFTVNLVMYDESQRLKQRTSKTSKMAARLANIGEYRVAMTGTPIDREPGEMWSQFRFINPDVFGTNWQTFLEEYYEPIPKFDFKKYRTPMARANKLREHRIKHGKPKFMANKMDDFLATIKPWSIVQDDSVLGLKDMKEVLVRLPMSSKQSRMYEEFRRTLVLNIARGKTITAPQRGVLLWKLHQIAGGFVKDEDGEVIPISKTKLNWLGKQEWNEPVAVCAKYVHEVEAIAYMFHRMGKRVGVIYGGTKKSIRLEVQEKFQRGELDIVVLQIKTGGVGIDLFAAAIIVFYSTTHSFIDYDQAKARIRRRGQTRDTRAFLLISEHTIDDALVTVLREKRKVTTKVIINLAKGSQHHGKGKD